MKLLSDNVPNALLYQILIVKNVKLGGILIQTVYVNNVIFQVVLIVSLQVNVFFVTFLPIILSYQTKHVHNAQFHVYVMGIIYRKFLTQ